jgi:hypothetical protein
MVEQTIAMREYGLMLESDSGATHINPIDWFLAKAYLTNQSALIDACIGYYRNHRRSGDGTPETMTSELEGMLAAEHKLIWGSPARAVRNVKITPNVKRYSDALYGVQSLHPLQCAIR